MMLLMQRAESDAWVVMTAVLRAEPAAREERLLKDNVLLWQRCHSFGHWHEGLDRLRGSQDERIVVALYVTHVGNCLARRA